MDCVESSGIVNDSRSRPMRRVLSESWPISQARASPKVHIHLASGWAQSREALLESNIKLAPSKHFHPMAQLPNPDSVHLYICTYVLLDLHFSLPVHFTVFLSMYTYLFSHPAIFFLFLFSAFVLHSCGQGTQVPFNPLPPGIGLSFHQWLTAKCCICCVSAGTQPPSDVIAPSSSRVSVLFIALNPNTPSLSRKL